MNKTTLIILLLLIAGFIFWQLYTKDNDTVSPENGNGETEEVTLTQAEAEERTEKFFADNESVDEYLENLEYVSATDWPPAIEVLTDEEYSCVEAGDEFDRAGATAEKEINGSAYCVTKVTEGAAGSSYTQYAYKREIHGVPAIATFSFRFPQCMNYDEPKQSECKAEQENFSVNEIIDSLFEQLMQK